MADERMITIVIKNEGSGDGSGTAKSAENVSEVTGSPDSDKDSSYGLAVAKAQAIQVVNSAMNELVAWADYEWSLNQRLSDDYIGQRNKSIANQMISKTTGAISTIASSTASGAALGGPVGAIVGAAIGALQVTASTIRSNVQGNKNQEIEIMQRERQLEYTRQRAGWSTQAASIGEDL